MESPSKRGALILGGVAFVSVSGLAYYLWSRNKSIPRQPQEQNEAVAVTPEVSNARLANLEAQKGFKLYNNKEYAASILCFTEAIRLQPDNHQFRTDRAIVYVAQKEPDSFPKALADAEASLSMCPTVKARWALGRALHGLGRLPEAIDQFERILASPTPEESSTKTTAKKYLDRARRALHEQRRAEEDAARREEREKEEEKRAEVGNEVGQGPNQVALADVAQGEASGQMSSQDEAEEGQDKHDDEDDEGDEAESESDKGEEQSQGPVGHDALGNSIVAREAVRLQGGLEDSGVLVNAPASSLADSGVLVSQPED